MRSSAVELDGFTPSLMLENKTPDPNSQPLKVEDILAKAEEIRNTRDRQSSVTNSDLGEAFKLFTVVNDLAAWMYRIGANFAFDYRVTALGLDVI